MDSRFSALCATILFIVAFLVGFIAKKKRSDKWIPSLENKHVLITGGSSGIGLAIAIRILEQGGFVTLISYSSSEIEDALQNQLKRYPSRVFTKVADVGNYEEISTAVKESFQWRPFDIVMCNAGVVERVGRLNEKNVRDLDVVIRTNLTGVVYTVHAALPFMKPRGNQHPQSLVLMGSMASLHPTYGHSIYTATKHALKGMAECLRLELLPFNIRVTLCCPFFARTPLLKSLQSGHDAQNGSFLRVMKVVDSYDPKRLMEPTEIAKATVEGIKKGSFLVVVGRDKIQELLLSSFCRRVFPAGEEYYGNGSFSFVQSRYAHVHGDRKKNY